MTGRPSLVARDVAYFAPNGDRLLHPISFAVEQGSVLAIAGPNGAGKSTLLNLLSGLEHLTLGDVLIEGQSLKSMSASDRAHRIAVVSQHGSPDGRLRLYDYVALGRIPIWSDRSAKDHADALAHVLDMTRLTDLANSPMARLSGGERQRAHIARALAQEPRLLFLDEPTNHLDPDAKGRMLSLVTSLGVTVIMVVHDLVMIPEFASHVAIINAAQLTGFGPVREVLTPTSVRDTFGVDYLEFPHQGRKIAALDIRKNTSQNFNKRSILP
ncbi:MAG: ABC transporter ATP-binding protein [Pseudomonadota bacterium]